MAQKRYLFTPGRPRCRRRCSPRSPSRCSTTARPTSARSTRACSGGCRRCTGRKARCSSSRAPGPARSSRRSSTSARRASACWRSRPAPSAALGGDGAHVRLLEVEELRYAWGETPTPDDLRAKLAAIEPVSLVFLVHSETSTGVVADVQSLARPRRAGALVVVDAVSSLGAVPLEQDDWGLDVVVSGSQKALMTPPGLATAAVSPRPGSRSRSSTLPSFYFDWERTRKAQAKLDSAFTPAVSLIVALDVSRSACCSRPGSRRSSATSASGAPPRRDQGDGAGALLAGRGSLRDRHRGPHAGQDRLERPDRWRCASATASRSPAGRGT